MSDEPNIDYAPPEAYFDKSSPQPDIEKAKWN